MLTFSKHPLAAWRRMDTDDTNAVGWIEFQDRCEQVNFVGNVAGAWRFLDQDSSGFISLAEFDSQSAAVLVSFHTWLETNFGSVKVAFTKLDRDGSMTLTTGELRRAFKRWHWDGDANLLYECLNVEAGPGSTNLSYHELSFLDSWELRLETLPEADCKDIKAAPRVLALQKSDSASLEWNQFRTRVSHEDGGETSAPPFNVNSSFDQDLKAGGRAPSKDLQRIDPPSIERSTSCPSLFLTKAVGILGSHHVVHRPFSAQNSGRRMPGPRCSDGSLNRRAIRRSPSSSCYFQHPGPYQRY